VPEAPVEKKCGKCGAVKVAADFGINRSRYDGLQVHCRDCKRAFQNAWYQKNKARHVTNVCRTRDRRVHALRKMSNEYLVAHPCVDCGDAETLMLDYDHVRGEKYCEISRMIAACYSWDKIMTEIAKCAVRCVKCHRRKTAAQCRWNQARL